MRVKVINEKESVIYKGNVRRFGEEFEMDSAIAKNLIQRGFVEEVNPEQSEEEDTVKGKFDVNDLEEMKYQDLKKLAKDIGVDASGTKEELIKRLSEQEIEVPFSDVDFFDEEDTEGPSTGMPE